MVGQLGSMGENGGQWFGLHMIAVDSKGTIYTGEVFNGERVQRLCPRDSSFYPLGCVPRSGSAFATPVGRVPRSGPADTPRSSSGLARLQIGGDMRQE